MPRGAHSCGVSAATAAATRTGRADLAAAARRARAGSGSPDGSARPKAPSARGTRGLCCKKDVSLWLRRP